MQSLCKRTFYTCRRWIHLFRLNLCLFLFLSSIYKINYDHTTCITNNKDKNLSMPKLCAEAMFDSYITMVTILYT